MNRLCIIIKLLAALLAAACSTDDIVPAAPVAEGVLTIDASVEGFKDPTSTRTVDVCYETNFVSGDEMGIIALCDGKVVSEVENIKATFDGEKWTAESSIVNISGATYMAYVPYDSSLKTDDISTTDDLAKCFASSVDNTGQATTAEYRSHDILVCKGGTIVGNKLSFNFSHAFGMVELVLPSKIYHLTSSDGSTKIDDYLIPQSEHLKFTGKTTLCKASTNCFRSIVRTDLAVEIKGVFEIGGKKQTYTYNMNPNTIQPGDCRRIIVDGCIEEDFSYEQGDFFLDDGTLVHRQDGLTAEEQKKCIGVIYYMDGDNSRFGTEELSALGTPHGYVLSLKTAASAICWGEYKDLPTLRNLTTIEEFQSDVDGLYNTLEMKADYTSGDYIYPVIKKYNEDVPTPSFCTEWFLPAMGQWFDLLIKLGDADFSGAVYTNPWGIGSYITTIPKIIHENINNKLAATCCAHDPINCSYSYYWSSSECVRVNNGNHACSVDLLYYNTNDLTTTIQFAYGNKTDKYTVRTIFAF